MLLQRKSPFREQAIDPSVLQRLLEEFVRSRPEWQTGRSPTLLPNIVDWPRGLARRCMQGFPKAAAALAARAGERYVGYRMTAWSEPRCFAVLEVDPVGWATVQLYRRDRGGSWEQLRSNATD